MQYDVTALPYHLRRGSAGIIGVGGGRDVLTAIRFGSPSITGIEINKAMLGAIEGPYRLIFAPGRSSGRPAGSR